MNYIQIREVSGEMLFSSDLLKAFLTDYLDNARIELDHLRTIYKMDRQKFIDIVNELRLRGAIFVLDNQNPLFSNIDIEKNEYIYVRDNQQRYTQLQFDRFHVNNLVKKYKIEDDRFFNCIPIEGFKTFNKSLCDELWKDHILECGFEIVTKEEILKRILDSKQEKLQKEALGEVREALLEELSSDMMEYIFPDEIKECQIKQIFTDNKEAQFIRFCELNAVECIGQIKPSLIAEYRQFKGVGEGKWQLVYTKVQNLLLGNYNLENNDNTYPMEEILENIKQHKLEGILLSEIFDGILLEYFDSLDKKCLNDIEQEIKNNFMGIPRVGKTKRDFYKQKLMDYIEKENKTYELLENYIIQVEESRYKQLKDIRAEEIQHMIGIMVPSIKSMSFSMLQGRNISDIGDEKEKVNIIKMIDTINHLSTVNELFSEAKQILKPRDIELLNYRYDMGYTLEECGKESGLTRERVRQLEMKAINKIIEYMIQNHMLTSMYLEFGLRKYIPINQVIDYLSKENVGIAIAFFSRQEYIEIIPEFDLFCLEGKTKIQVLCREVEEYLEDVFRVDEEEDLLLEMYRSIGFVDITFEDLQQYLIKIGYKKSGYFYSKHRLSLSEMYSIVLRDGTSKSVTLDDMGMKFIKQKFQEIFHYELTTDLRAIEARFADAQDILNIASKTYIHANNIDITPKMIESVEKIIEEQLQQCDVIQSGDIYRLYQNELIELNIHDKYLFYAIAKRYLDDGYCFGNGNTMSITRKDNAENLTQTSENMMIEKLRDHNGKMEKKEFISIMNWHLTKVENIISKSSDLISFGKYIWSVKEYGPNQDVNDTLIKAVTENYQRDGYVSIQRVFKDTIVNPEVYHFYNEFGITEARELASYIKYLVPYLKGHSLILFNPNSEVTSVIDLIKSKFQKRCLKGDIYEFLAEYGYKEAAAYNILGGIIKEKAYYLIDGNELILNDEFETLFVTIHEVVKGAIDERVGNEEYLILNNVMANLRRSLPRIEYRWTPELIISIIQECGYRKIERENTDYRTERNIVVKESSSIKSFDQLIYYIVKQEYDGIMHESYIRGFLTEKGILSTQSHYTKLPYEVHQSELFSIDELGRVTIV